MNVFHRRAVAAGAALLVVGGLGAVEAQAQQGAFEFYNGFDPAKPTIVAVHGWFGSIDYNSTFGRSPSFDQRANVIGWEWNAVFFTNMTARARQSGRQLAQELALFIIDFAPGYEQPIQLIGHSLGTHVVLAAGAELRDLGRNDPGFAAYQADQITLVDTGFNDEIPAAIANVENDYLVPLKLDNYFSIPSAGGTGQAYAGRLANVRIPLSHTDMWSYYFETLDQQTAGRVHPGATYGVVGPYRNENYGAVGAYLVTGQATPLDLSDDVYRLVN